MSELILSDNHKKALCKYYECSNGLGHQYPHCDTTPEYCHIVEIQDLMWFINQEKNQVD